MTGLSVELRVKGEGSDSQGMGAFNKYVGGREATDGVVCVK